jgi:hypothetical protein
MCERSFSLPGGYRDRSGAVQREARVVPLSGAFEDELFTLARDLPQARMVSEVLGRSVATQDGEPLTVEGARQLLACDREYALLELHRSWVGDALDLVITCPFDGCGAKMDLALDARALPFTRRELGERYEAESPFGRVLFRLPCGHDEESAATEGAAGLPAAIAALLRRCVVSVGGRAIGDILGEDPEGVTLLALTEAVEAELARVAPGLDLELDVVCPDCGRTAPVDLDLSSIVLSRLFREQETFEAELHLLARHYHWQPSEILSLPATRRRRFVQRLLRELEAGPRPFEGA